MSNNIGWREVASNQNQKEVTINEQVSILDAALTERLTLTGAGPFTPSVLQFNRVVEIYVDPAATAVDITVPSNKKLFILNNRDGTVDASLVKGATTLTVPTGIALPFYSGEGIDELHVLTGFEIEPVEYRMSAFKSLAPAASEVIAQFIVNRQVTLPLNLEGSEAYAGITATITSTLDIQINGVSAGTLTFDPSVNAGTFTFTPGQIMSPGDVLTIIANAAPDNTLGDISVTIKGTII